MKKTMIVLLSLSMLGLTACGAANQPVENADAGKTADKPSQTTQAEQKPVTLSVWTTNKDLLADQVKAFEAKYPTIKIKAEFMGGYDEMAQKVMAAVVSNTLPNVVQLGQRHGIPQMADSGKLLPIEQFMSEQEKTDVYPAFWDRFRYKDKLWTIPYNSSTPMLYYNKTLFDQAGLKAPNTWDELVKAAQTLTKDTNGDGKVDVWGFNTAADSPWYVQPMTWNRGGSIVDKAGKVTVNSKEAVEALKSFQDLVHVQKAMAPNQHNTAEQDFSSGKLAMIYKSGSALAGTQKEVGQKFEIGVAYLPMIKDRNVPIGGNSLGIFKSDPDMEKASWTFVSYLTNTENAAATSISTGYAPIKKSATETDAFKKKMSEDPNFKIIMDQNQFLRGQGIHPADSLIWSGLVTALETVEGDAKADPQKVLDKLQADVDSFMKSYK
ncbi:ABC transporter substrate-binding protein [Paenibacillus sp. MAH-36]|uniref:ABC transporter substrate-binding protein n=1 Tax=Paenibacillus violae TaxID=3077234 RepID=A0ABU3RNI1_9BACL|nr:ABC transporter substrate-binding protein [Paenibacillus sp. PFR10]MDU0205569.1 ABC transporter substrate-binding protein [Paenibacillus sp. PFR10]